MSRIKVRAFYETRQGDFIHLNNAPMLSSDEARQVLTPQARRSLLKH